MEVTTIGLDLAKNVFQAHGADASGSVVFRKQLRRRNVLEFIAKQPGCTGCYGSLLRSALLGARDCQVRPLGAIDPTSLRQTVRQIMDR